MCNYIKLFIIYVITLISCTTGQLFYHHSPPPIPYSFQAQPQIRIEQQVPLAHRAVIENAYKESMLPQELLRSNKFYNNPLIADGLAKESWFTNKEMPVFDRAAEKIPREMVFKIFRNAGWIKRR